MPALKSASYVYISFDESDYGTAALIAECLREIGCDARINEYLPGNERWAEALRRFGFMEGGEKVYTFSITKEGIDALYAKNEADVLF